MARVGGFIVQKARLSAAMIDRQIHVAVVVIVSHGDPAADVRTQEIRSRSLRNILKIALAVTAKKLSGLLVGLRSSILGLGQELRIAIDMAIGNEDVE